MNQRLLLAALVAAVSTAGCKKLSTGARESFGRIYSCPDNQITVTARDDLKASTLMAGGASGPEEQPPEEVKREPARLAKWREERAKDREFAEKRYERHEVFAVTGCGHSSLLCCEHPHVTSGGSTGEATDRVECVSAPERR
jgi:hypothetical protein